MKKVFIDCNNTMGIEGRPMDDALAILYLLGKEPNIQILGIAVNFGNGTSAESYECTKKLLSEIGRSDIPVFLGAEINSGYASEAASAIASMVNGNPGEITYLSIGTLTNLYGAYLENNDTLKNLKQLIIMGGITEPLIINDKPLSELNLSIDYHASYCVLTQGHNISIITGNNCLPVSSLPKDEFLDKLCLSEASNGSPTGMYIAQKCGYRFKENKRTFDIDSSHCWDGIAAVYLCRPKLFKNKTVHCFLTEDNLKHGYLNPVDESEANVSFNLPETFNKSEIQKDFYNTWLSIEIPTKSADFSCSGFYLDKLIQPCILIELSKEPCHGLLLLQNLKEKGAVDESLDPAGFYRNLKRMESDGFLSSVSCGNGPKSKKIYSITDFGKRALLNWKDSLLRYSDYINSIIERID